MYPKRDSSFAVGDPNAALRIVIFHGYTGSTDEFEPLAEKLSTQLNAFVSVPLLPGHGTNEADLLHLTYDDFITFARNHVASIHTGAARLVVIGHSFGGYLAIECAAEYVAHAVVLTVVPFILRFPLNLPGIAWVMRRKLFWNKKIPLQEKIERIGLFYYRFMPGIALTILKDGIRRSRKALRKITSPILAINTTEDPLSYASSGTAILSLAQKNDKSVMHLVARSEHGLFYGKNHEKVVEDITTFVEQALA